jgi:hypothetical protein
VDNLNTIAGKKFPYPKEPIRTLDQYAEFFADIAKKAGLKLAVIAEIDINIGGEIEMDDRFGLINDTLFAYCNPKKLSSATEGWGDLFTVEPHSEG